MERTRVISAALIVDERKATMGNSSIFHRLMVNNVLFVVALARAHRKFSLSHQPAERRSHGGSPLAPIFGIELPH
jgi:hypothetical protein